MWKFCVVSSQEVESQNFSQRRISVANFVEGDTVTRVSDILLNHVVCDLNYLVGSWKKGQPIPEQEAYHILSGLLDELKGIELEYQPAPQVEQ